jgi:hypothetical protein
MKILFVGLSNKLNKEPFDIHTNSGKIVHDIIKQLNHECYLVNLVQYPPVDKNGKLRYPTKLEIKEAIPAFLKYTDTIKPDLIVSFGKTVSDELSKIVIINKILLTKNHPSYIWVYKRNSLDSYIDDIVKTINSI